MFWKFLALFWLGRSVIREAEAERDRAESEARRLEREIAAAEREAERERIAAERDRTAPPRRCDLIGGAIDWAQLELALVIPERTKPNGGRPVALVFPPTLSTDPTCAPDPSRTVAFVIYGIDRVRVRLSPSDPLRLRVYRHGAGRSSFRYLPIWESQAEALGCRIVELAPDSQA